MCPVASPGHEALLDRVSARSIRQEESREDVGDAADEERFGDVLKKLFSIRGF